MKWLLIFFTDCNGAFVRDYYKDESSFEARDKNLQQQVIDMKIICNHEYHHFDIPRLYRRIGFCH